jgi:hypothetical protein
MSGGLFRLGRLALVALVASPACGGGGTPTAPTTLPDGSPVTAHSISDSQLTVRYWFEITPPVGATVVDNQNYTIVVNCRSSMTADYNLILLFDLLAPDGLPMRPRGSFFDLGDVNRGIGMPRCVEGTNNPVTSSLPSFPRMSTIDQIRVRVWLKPAPPGQPGPVPSGDPDSTVFERVNWTYLSR